MVRQTTTDAADSFLSEAELRPLSLDDARGLEPVGLALGQGQGALEVAITRSSRCPQQATMRSVWHARHGGRAAPLLLVTLYGDHAALCGPGGEQPPVYLDLDPGQVERLCLTALAEPDRHAAARFLRSVVPEVESPLPGLRNEGLFATQELSHGVPGRSDWQEAQQRAEPLLTHRGRELLEGLGYQIEELPGSASVLRIQQTKVAVAIFLDRNEATDVASARFGGVSPVSYALAKADAENLPYVVVNRGSALRIYPTASGVGTGRRGRTDTFIEIHLDLLPSDQAAYLWLLFSGDALTKGGTFEDILDLSSDYAAELGKRLRERVYGDIVPRLAIAVVEARNLRRPTAQDLKTTYEMTLTVLFRLLFIAYAEDKDLLPYRTNELYKVRSLKAKARELADLKRNRQNNFDDSATHWDEFKRLCQAVNEGQREWGVPAYNGGLFVEDRRVSEVGALLAGISLPNSQFAPALTSLLVDETPEGFGPVDFRSLGVREFGTIYEGLLESELSVAEVDLIVDKNGFYAPAEDRPPAVRKGEIYLHNASGARKATGSYYTKDFAVEHLLDHSLEPALAEHIERLDGLDDRKAGEAFFDFRVADIAMGSAHFLVTAVDRIERRLSSYLAHRQLPDVVNELARLKAAACEAMDVPADVAQIEDTQLLRRQIARRCIYGVDINPVAVQLARLSLWIHTFVPGLPLSFLDRTLICGNSLVGIATFEEVSDLLDLSGGGLFAATAQTLLGSAESAIGKLARLSDANAAEIRRARQAYEEEKRAIAPTERMFDILTAKRMPESGVTAGAEEFKEENELFLVAEHKKATEFLKPMPPFHFPIAFPEVFLRERAGFDVIVGNPPWEKARLEEHAFWARYSPGLRALPQHEQETLKEQYRQERPDLVAQYEKEVAEAELLRRVLTTGPFPGMGTGDPDLYKAFCWRFWNLICTDCGRLGVVLPRSAFNVKGSTPFRIAIFTGGSLDDLTILLNTRGWVFDDAEPRYTIALASVMKDAELPDKKVRLRGPFPSLPRFFAGMDRPSVEFSVSEVLTWTDTAALPLLPAEESAEVFAQLRKAPRLDLDEEGQWRARPCTELHATNDKERMELVERRPRGYWPVFKGESFDIWNPDTGSYYAWAEPRAMREHLHNKRTRASRNQRSPFFEFAANLAWLRDQATLPCMRPRIAFRDVTNRTNRRTVVVALIPPHVFINHKGPYFLWPRGDKADQAYLLGVLSSIPLDWYARRFVEVSLTYHVLNPFPVPRPDRDDPLWQRTVELAGRLACPDERFAEWAEAVGVECGPIPEPEKEEMIFELDAVVAHLYGLTEAHVRHIFETFHEGWDYHARLDAVLRHYRQWAERGSHG